MLKRKSLIITYSILSALMFFFVCVISKLTTEGNLVWSFPYFLRTLAFSAVCGIFVGGLFGWGVYQMCRGSMEKETLKEAVCRGEEREKKLLGGLSPFLVGLCSFGLLLLAWLPVFLAYYPGICAYDSYVQLEQIVNGAYNEHHPLIHTLLLQGCMELGRGLFHSANAGIALYSVLQSVLLAGAMAYGVTFLLKAFVRKGMKAKTISILLGAVQCYMMFCPFHAFLAVSVTKDVIFSAFMLMQTISLLALLEAGEKGNFAVNGSIFVIASVGAMLFRNNGKYAMLVLIFGLFMALVYGFKKKRERAFWGKLFAASLASLLLSMVLLGSLASSLGAVQGDKREMLSIPIQQLARTMIYHGGAGVLEEDDNTMALEDKALIQEFLLNESYKLYRPDISDPVKRNTNTYVARYRIKDFLNTYVGLFLKYPGEYVNAFLAVNAGYLNIADTSHSKINLSDTESGLGYVQTRWEEDDFLRAGVYKDSKWPALFSWLEQWADSNAYLNIPVFSLLLKPGIYFWICVGTAVTFMLRRQFRMLLPLLFAAGYYLTLLFGPTVQLRYVYPIMLIVPFIMCVCGWSIRRSADDETVQ